jgi:hypothetical protein
MTNHHSARINKSAKVSANIPLLRTKLKIYASALAVVAFSMFVYVFFMHGLDWFILAAALIIALVSVKIFTGFGAYLTTLNNINDVLVMANKGQLTKRITQTKGQGEVGKVAWELNEFFDMVHMQSFCYVCTIDDELLDPELESHEIDNGMHPIWMNIHQAISHNEHTIATSTKKGLSIERETFLLKLIVNELLTPTNKIK